MELEEYRQPQETIPHWELRKEFLLYYKDFFPEDRLLCLAQVYANIELLQCSYPPEVMTQIQKLIKHLKANKKVSGSENKESNDESKIQNKKKNKRKCEETLSHQSVKKSKDAEQEEKDPTENEDLQCEMLPSGMAAVYYKEIVEAENFDVIQKLSEEVQKLLKLQNGNAYDVILSASLHLNVEDAIDFKYTDHSIREGGTEVERYYCEFFIGATKLAIGCGENRYIAKKTASEKALDTLSNLKLIKELGAEMVKLYDSSDEDNPLNVMFTAACHLGMENSLHFKFSKATLNSKDGDYTYQRHYCEFCIGATLLASYNASNKKIAKKLTLKFAFHLLTHHDNIGKISFDDCIQPKQDMDPVKSKYDIKLLEKMAYPIKKQIMKNKSPLDALQHCFHVIKRNGHLSFNAYRDLSVPVLSGESLYICELLVNNVLITKGRANKKKIAKREAAQKMVNLFLDVFERKKNSSVSSEEIYADLYALFNKPPVEPEKFDSSTSSLEKEKPAPSIYLKGFETAENKDFCDKDRNRKINYRNSSFTINEKLYDNSIKLNYLLYDMSDHSKYKDIVSTDSKILQFSADKCFRKMKFRFIPEIENTYRAYVILDSKVVASATNRTKSDAKDEIARILLEKLKKEVYTIKLGSSFSIEDTVIEPNHLLELRLIFSEPESKDGHSRKPIRKIICPENKNLVRLFQKYSNLAKNVILNGLKTKVETLLEGYSKSNALNALRFSEKFTSYHKVFIKETAKNYGLRHFKKPKKNHFYVKRKIGVKDILDVLIENGGKTQQYELLDLST